MREADLCGVVFALLSLWLGWLIARCLREGEIVGRYGRVLTRAAAPRRFWAVVGLHGLLLAVCLTFTVMAFLSPIGR